MTCPTQQKATGAVSEYNGEGKGTEAAFTKDVPDMSSQNISSLGKRTSRPNCAPRKDLSGAFTGLRTNLGQRRDRVMGH